MPFCKRCRQDKSVTLDDICGDCADDLREEMKAEQADIDFHRLEEAEFDAREEQAYNG